MDENYLQITIVGQGGVAKGTVCTDKISLEGLTDEKITELVLKTLTSFNNLNINLGFFHPRLIKASETGWIKEDKTGSTKYEILLVVKGNPGYPEVEARFSNEDPREARKEAHEYLRTLPVL